MLVNLPAQIRNVNSTVTFSRDIKVVWKSFWEFFKPCKKGNHCILGLSYIILDIIRSIILRFPLTGNTVSNSSRWLDVEHIGSSVPRVWVCFNIRFSIINNPRSMFLKHAQKWWTPRTSIKPNNQRIKTWLVHRIDINIMQSLTLWDIQVSRVTSRRHLNRITASSGVRKCFELVFRRETLHFSCD